MKGGKRQGAGRPKGDQTTTISFRVKSKHVEDLKTRIKILIKELESNQ